MVAVTPPRARQAQANSRNLVIAVGASLFLLVVALGFFLFSSQTQSSHAAHPITTRSKNHNHWKLLPALKPKEPKEEPWPEVADIIDINDKKERTIIKDPQFLLDFAIIGFEKSGSSTFMKWLGDHPQIQCPQEEIYDMYLNKPAALVKTMMRKLKPGYQYKRGYKSPGDIFFANVIHLLDDYFPKTRLILSLRHPVRYYESLYNCKCGCPIHVL